MTRRHQKADADLPQTTLHHRHVGVDVDAERRQHVRRDGNPLEQVLGAAGDDQCRRSVEQHDVT